MVSGGCGAAGYRVHTGRNEGLVAYAEFLTVQFFRREPKVREVDILVIQRQEHVIRADMTVRDAKFMAMLQSVDELREDTSDAVVSLPKVGSSNEVGERTAAAKIQEHTTLLRPLFDESGVDGEDMRVVLDKSV